MVEVIKSGNLALRFLLELAALAALGIWGFHTGNGVALKWLLGIGAPLAFTVVWGTFGSPGAPYPITGIYRTLLELLIFSIAAGAFFFSLHHKLAGIYVTLAIVNLFLLRFWKQ